MVFYGLYETIFKALGGAKWDAGELIAVRGAAKV